MRLNTAVFMVTLALGAVLGGCTAKSNPAPVAAPSAPVRIASAVVRTVPVEVHVVGSVEAYSTIVVKSQVGGILTKVFFKEGDPVRKDDLLFEIDPRSYEQIIKQWEANLVRDQAMLMQAKANLARDLAQQKYAEQQALRYAQLHKEGVFSREQADQMRSDADAKMEAVRADQAAIDSANAAIVADSASLGKAKVDLSYCQIRSPVDGRTGNLAIKQGNLVKATDVELVTILQIQPVYVTFGAPEGQLSEIRARMKSGRLTVHASTQSQGGPSADGTLTFIDNSVDNTTGTIKLKATFSNASAEFWPGQFLNVSLRLSELPNSIVIPAAALQNGQSGNYVFVVKSDDTVEMREVKVGPKAGTDISIEKGIQAGERVVTEGHVRLVPGTRVRILT